MTKILQLSDTHLSADGIHMSGHLATELSLKKLIDRLIAARDQWGAIDAVVVTGDISEDGSDDSYRRFDSLLTPLDLPVFVLPGNHDAREPMRRAFHKDGYLPETGPLNWSRCIGDIQVIGLDTLVEGQGYGELTLETLQFLDAQLSKIRQQPVLLALHHPPFNTGISFMDAIGLQNTNAFTEVMAVAQGEVRIVCGHVHSLFVTSTAGHVTVSSPSPCSNFELDFRDDAPVGFFARDDGCMLHCWHDGFQSVRIGPSAGSGPHPFTGC